MLWYSARYLLLVLYSLLLSVPFMLMFSTPCVRCGAC